MRKWIVMMLSVLAFASQGMAQTTGVQFESISEKEVTKEQLAALLATPNLAEVDALCRQVAADGVSDALVRTKLFALGQVVSAPGKAAQHRSALEALYAKYAKESASPVQQLFFIEQLRWIGTQRSLPVIMELTRSQDVNIAASAHMTRQSIARIFDPATVVFPPTKMRQLNEAVKKADAAGKFRLLAAALQTKGDLPYQAFAARKIGGNLTPENLSQWCALTRQCDEPGLIVLMLRSLSARPEPAVFDLLLEMGGHTDALVSAAALAILAQQDTAVLQKILPERLANVTPQNSKAFAAFLATLPASVVVPALTTAFPGQSDLGKQLTFETLAAYPGSPAMVKAAVAVATAPASDAKLARAAFRYLRTTAGAGECDALLASLSTVKGALQSEAAQTYGMAARTPGNEIYDERLLQALKSAGASPSEVLLETAARSGSAPLLVHVSSLAATNKDALRALSTWRDGMAAPALMQALAGSPRDAFLLRSVRQQLQSTMADAIDLMKGWRALVASGQVPGDDLRDFAAMINSASNIALNRPVTATRNQEADHAPRFMVDGDTSNNSGLWISGSPVEITVDLEATRRVAAAHLFFYAGDERYYQYRIDTSLDNQNWQLAIDRSSDTTPSTAEGFRLTFEPREARYVKLTVTKNSNNPSIHVNELMLFSSAESAVIDLDKIAAPLPAPDAEGFHTLFDGTNLDAWTGNKHSYTINENKELAVDPSKGGDGNLYTINEYDDFILRFEFKLTPGANNGIGVRVPRNTNAAYEGFEIQVLDDTAEKYATLQPYQYHGSVYGIIPAKRGALKPVGEWNSEEIVMDGRHVKVTVNGQVIVDANLDEASKDGTMDKKDHPGLKRTTGYISFCGHGDPLWFRNVKIKPIIK